MTSYAYQTKAQELFEGDVFLVHEYKVEKDYNTLYVDYDFGRNTVELLCYDGVKSAYVDEYIVGSFAEASFAIKELDKKYPNKIELDDLLYRFKAFFAVTDRAVYINSSVTDTIDDEYLFCDTCGSFDGNTYEFLFIPAIPEAEITEASLYLHYEYGCYGGEKVFGDFNEVRNEVLELLDSMRNRAEENLVSDVDRAIQAVKDNTVVA